MKLASPRRGFAAMAVALVSAVLILPSGAAVADQHATPPTSEVETTTSVPSVPPTAPDDAASPATEQSSSPEPTVEASVSTAPDEPAEAAEPTEAPAPAEEADQEAVQSEPLNAPAQSGSALTCEPGYVYSMGRAGQVYEINPSGRRTELANFGSRGTGNAFNGIGIGSGGTPTYAYHRDSQTRATIYRWNGPGSAPESLVTYTHGLSGDLVAGAVDLNTGDYYFGGYERHYRYSYGSGWWQTKVYEYQFRIWKYNAASNSVQYVGYVNTGIDTEDISAANGDMAFNDQGNLFFLISGGSQAAIGTITAGELEGSLGDELQSSSTEMKTLGGTGGANANGIAFDADGSIYLGTSSYLYKYNPTTWQQIGSPQNVLRNSTDLAGCSSPSSIEVTKNVVDRKDDNDQFTLEMHSGNDVIAQAITEGSATGRQEHQIGPVPALYQDTFSISEAMAEGSESALPDDYDTSWVCTDGDGWQDSGQGTTFDVTVTKLGQSIACEFTNAPLSDTELTLVKAFDTKYGAPEDTDDWTLTATPDGGDTMEFAHEETQRVEAGDYTISEFFGDNMAPGDAGYDLTDITCTADGQDIPVAGDGSVTLEDRTATECVLTNADQPGTVVWQKVDTDGNQLAGSEWQLTGPEGFGEVPITDNGEHDADDRDGYFRVEGLHWGQYTLEETVAPDGYELLEDSVDFAVQGTDLDYAFDVGFENIAIPTLTLYKAFETQYGAPEVLTDWNLFATSEDDELVFEHGETQRVAEGTYQLSETYGADGQEAAAVGYELQEIVCTVDGEDQQVLGGELTIEQDTAIECTFINIDLPGAVQWEKTNATGDPLADSEWSLSGPDGFGELAVVDNGEYDVIETAGTIRVEGLHWGDYTLEETQAPAGFQLISGTEEFQISGTGREYVFDESFVNEPLAPGELPLTGVFSGKWPLIGAASLALAVLGGLTWSLRQRQSK
ncbi:hypothetical protein GCM10009720_18570 [Yaniella flava]|uniref:Uncharacterized protein n=1 Tax=Yaniella flava TaxID=287930 RepID=A0ABP5G182_9MICC